MSEENALQMPENKGWESIVLRILKWLAIIAVFVFILLTVLSRMGGNSDVLRQAVEDFLSDSTPYSARVGTLNSMRFFPNIVVDVADIELRTGDDGTGETVVRIGAAKFVMPFFDVMFRPGHFKDIQIQNLKAMPGSLLKKSVSIETIAVQDQDQTPTMVMNGKIGNAPLRASIGLHGKGQPGRRTYIIGRERPFEATLADLSAQGTIRNTISGDYKFENVALSHGENDVLLGNVDLDRAGAGRLKLSAQLRVEPGKSRLDPNLTLDWSGETLHITGQIKAKELLLSDVNAAAPLQKAIQAINEVIGEQSGGALNLGGLSLELDLDLQKIMAGKVALGNLKTPLTLKDSQLHLGPLNGKIIGGALSGDMHLNAEESPAKLTQKIIIKGFDYAALQEQLNGAAEIEGHADILIDLSSEGTNIGALTNGLSGKAGFVGGKGKMRSGLLNVWGGGLLNALLPSFEESSDVNMNCVVVNLDIKNFKGHSDSVFVDTQRVTLHGEGTYDFRADQLEMVLEPKPKDVSIGDIAAAVNVSGPLSGLSASPNVYDLGKKVGGFLLGAVNPAFYAVTLADLGLNDDHPCKAFVIEKEVLPAPDVPEEKEILTVPETLPETEQETAPPSDQPAELNP